jgi:hypothetical protein
MVDGSKYEPCELLCGESSVRRYCDESAVDYCEIGKRNTDEVYDN